MNAITQNRGILQARAEPPLTSLSSGGSETVVPSAQFARGHAHFRFWDAEVQTRIYSANIPKTHAHEAATRYSYSVLVGKCQFLALLHHRINVFSGIQSCSINGSFILRGWSCTNVLTSSLMFSSDNSLLQRSLLIFIKVNPLNLDWLMVARLISFN